MRSSASSALRTVAASDGDASSRARLRHAIASVDAAVALLQRGEPQEELRALGAGDVASRASSSQRLELARLAAGLERAREQVLEPAVARRIGELAQHRDRVFGAAQSLEQETRLPVRELAAARGVALAREAPRQHVAQLLDAVLLGEQALEQIARRGRFGLALEGGLEHGGGLGEVAELASVRASSSASSSGGRSPAASSCARSSCASSGSLFPRR